MSSSRSRGQRPGTKPRPSVPAKRPKTPVRAAADTPAATTPPTPRSSPIVTLPLPILFALGLGLAALGFAVGTADAFAQARTLDLGVRIPIGSVLAVAALGAVAFSAGLLTRSRVGLGVVALGWVVSVVLFTSARAEGDVIIAADVAGYSYLFGGVVVLTVLSTVRFATLGGAKP